jgi:hypothetical protein
MASWLAPLSSVQPPEQRVSDRYRPPIEVDTTVSPKATWRLWMEALGALALYLVFTYTTDAAPFLPASGGIIARLTIAATGAVLAACLVPLVVIPITCLWKSQRTRRAIARNFCITMLALFGLQVTDRILKVTSDGKRGLNAIPRIEEGSLGADSNAANDDLRQAGFSRGSGAR